MLWPTICAFCREADPEEASEYCSASCKAKVAMTHDPAFGKAFTSGVLAAVNESGPYMFSATSEVGKATLECYPTKDAHKAGSKKPERHCQWNDGWDIRTQVRFNGEQMSFQALKEKIDSDSYEEAHKKMDELKDRLKAVAVQAVQTAKVAAANSLSEGWSVGEAARAAQTATVAALPQNSSTVSEQICRRALEEAMQQSTSADEPAQDKKKRKTDNVESHGSFTEEPFTEDWIQKRATDIMESGPSNDTRQADTEAEGLQLLMSAKSNSGYMGVTKVSKNRFEAFHKNTYIGSFATAVEAAVVYAKAVGGSAETKGPETKVKAAIKSADKVEVGAETKAKAPAKNIDNVKVGFWVTVQAASRRTVDQAKADAPCLVTLVDSSYAHVLYPNLLSVFLSEKTDSEVAIKFRTEKCDLQSIRAYTADISTLDRKMVINLCQAVSKASTPQARASNAAASSEASTHETPVKLSKHATRGHDWLRQFTARVAQAFKAAGREALDKTALHTSLTSQYASQEITEGLATLEALNKVIISDDAIFLAC